MKYSFLKSILCVSSLIVFFITPHLGSAQNLRTTDNRTRRLRQLTESCIGIIAEVQFDRDDDNNSANGVGGGRGGGGGGGGPPREETFLSCLTEDRMLYKVRLAGKSFIEKNFQKGGFQSGKTELLFDSDAVVDEANAEILSRSPPGLRKKEENSPNGDNNGRRLDALYGTTEGSPSVLIVRVEAVDGTTGFSEAEISNSVFGNGAGGLSVDSVTLKSQYLACSHNKLNFVEAPYRSGTDIDIINGATTVTVNVTTAEGNDVMVNAITAELLNQFGVTSETQLANHLMYCLPANTIPNGGIAYGYINWALTVYSNEWCTYVSAQMHELAHNLNMAHSNELGTYKDQTGMMGYSYAYSDIPEMCFNGAKLWQFGWYSSRHNSMDIVSNRIYSGNLMSIFEDPDDVAGDPMLIKIDNGSQDYFIHFNRVTSYNQHTQEGPDQVLITQAGNGDDYFESELLAKLDAGKTFLLTADGATVEVKVNSISTAGNGYANIDVRFTNESPAPSTAPSLAPSGSPSISPSSYPTAPTTAPSSLPSIAPSSAPSNSPSMAPSRSPSNQPSSTPTNSPSKAPSSSPSKSPTTLPSSSPSKTPSSTPTNAPSKAPSSSPSKSPTTLPSLSPSKAPSSTPTNAPTETPSLSPSKAPSLSPTTSPSKAPSALPSKSPTSTPSLLPSKAPSSTPTNSPTKAPSSSPSKSPTTTPSLPPSKTPSYSPSNNPSMTPSSSPTKQPSFTPTNTPSKEPSFSPSKSPTTTPSSSPSKAPSSTPTKSPSKAPSSSPSKSPTTTPSSMPSKAPSSTPTTAPTETPSLSPTKAPSSPPTMSPTEIPSYSPSTVPSTTPTFSPSKAPSLVPSKAPTDIPSSSPTSTPSANPSSSPTKAPTPAPTPAPTISCSGVPDKNTCVSRSDCAWQGNPNSGSCNPSGSDTGGGSGSGGGGGSCSSYNSKNTCQQNSCSWSNSLKICS